MKPKLLLLSAVVVSLVQIGFLLFAIHGRAELLRSGQEVTLETQPVDPRDLLRGDYVWLSYGISRLPAGLVRTERPRDGQEIGALYVRLRLGDGTEPARPIGVGLGAPVPEPLGDGEIDIKGMSKTFWIADLAEISATYGIERFYLPEGEGRAVEANMRERNFLMRIVVGKDGAAQIKALYDGTTRIYSEPLY